MILQSDVEFKQATERRLRSLENALLKAGVEIVDEDDMDETEESPQHSQLSQTQITQTEKQAYEIVMDNSGPAAIPGSVVSSIAIPGLETDRGQQDIISRGIVTVQQAQSYLDIYQNRLDHFLYRIIGDRKNLNEVRAASPILLAAICVVGSLHLNTPEFERLYSEFVSIAAAQTFSRRNNVDDIRGLCVAAFWLSDVSWRSVHEAAHRQYCSTLVAASIKRLCNVR
jgi:hypothetical protein